MHQTFSITKTSRKALSHLLDIIPLEQLNKIPEGFNNNIIWNIAHSYSGSTNVILQTFRFANVGF